MNNFAYVQFTGRRAASATESEPAATRRTRTAFAVPPTPATGRQEGRPLNGLLSTILSRNSLSYDAYRPNALERRLPAVQRRLRVRTPEEACKRLDDEPELLSEALSVVLIGVTGFFRDRAVFDALRDRFLPEMIGGGKPLRVLSAGSSRGHELYSVAMLLAEAGALQECELLGVDCRPEAIAGAGAGLFSDQDLEPVDSVLRHRYFQPSRNGWEIRPSIRKLVDWRVEDILTETPAGPWDLVLFRNVAIYLQANYAHEVWQRLCRNTRPGGLIVVGKADQPPPSLPLERITASIYRRLSK